MLVLWNTLASNRGMVWVYWQIKQCTDDNNLGVLTLRQLADVSFCPQAG